MPTPAATTLGLQALTRPSGAFAMLALDQREALRVMFHQYRQRPIPDEELTEFKITTTRMLSPHASGVLLDRQFALDRAIDDRAVAPGCGLIAAADHFVPGEEEFVADARIDEDVDPAHYRARGAVAMKLLVIYRPDGDPRERIAMVERFVERCHSAGLVSIIEPVSRAPHAGGSWDWTAGILAAARELGALGADLYKAEVPLAGQGDSGDIRRHCATITASVTSPWVVLSTGVQPDAFPEAVELACREGASGFLAGRAVWRTSIAHPDLERALREEALPRLRHLSEVADSAVASRTKGSKG